MKSSTEYKQYAVYLSCLQYGCAHVEAASKEEAEEKARKLYNNRQIDWYDEELTDVSAETE